MDELEFVPAVYIGREDARGGSLDASDRFVLKEERGIPKEERIREASRRTRKKDAKIEFTIAWKNFEPSTDNSLINEAFRASAEGLPHFKELNMGMLAASWMLWLNLIDKNKTDEPITTITPKDIRGRTTATSKRTLIDSNFTRELRKILLSPTKGGTTKSLDLARDAIEWDLVRYVMILIKFQPKVKSETAKR